MAKIDGLLAKDVMQTRVISVGANDPLDSIHRLFGDEEISGAPVVGDEGELVGVVSLRDLITARRDEIEDPARDEPDMRFFQDGVYLDDRLHSMLAGDAIDSLAQLTASDVMSPEVVSVSSSTPLAEVARQIIDNRIHRVLVVDPGERGDTVVGIISLLDLVKVLV